MNIIGEYKTLIKLFKKATNNLNSSFEDWDKQLNSSNNTKEIINKKKELELRLEYAGDILAIIEKYNNHIKEKNLNLKDSIKIELGNFCEKYNDILDKIIEKSKTTQSEFLPNSSLLKLIIGKQNESFPKEIYG